MISRYDWCRRWLWLRWRRRRRYDWSRRGRRCRSRRRNKGTRTMERREKRLEKRREPIGFRFESRGRTMQTRAASICLFELVANDSSAFERAVNQVTLCMFQFSSGTEFFAVDGEFGAHPIRRQWSVRPVEENKTGNLTIRRENFECSTRTQSPVKVPRQPKRKMRLRKLKIDSRFVVNPAYLDVLHCSSFLSLGSWQCEQKPQRFNPPCALISP
jgi:hypothetical protein